MKAIAPVLIAVLMLAGCASQTKPQPPALPPPPPRPAPPPPPPPAPFVGDWRDAPITPGIWQWQNEAGQSVARFGGQITFACETASRTVTLRLGQTALVAQPVVITTTSQRRVLTGQPETTGLTVRLPAGDPLLDAMAFSRGRFMVETPGLPVFYLPSWAEVSRVIEDCR